MTEISSELLGKSVELLKCKFYYHPKVKIKSQLVVELKVCLVPRKN